MSMSPEQVIALADAQARRTGAKWTLNGLDIRCGARCPLEMAADTMACNYRMAAWRLGLNPSYVDEERVINMVMGAADGGFGGADVRALRALMLATFDFADVDNGGGR